jgi:2-(1,2-epoxy-1,2-dihydrophenyl)acetyl-CoA isomerase
MGASLFADKISAEQAADWGMIWEAVEDERFEEVWRAARRISPRARPRPTSA